MKGHDQKCVVIASRFWGEKEDDIDRLWRFLTKCNTALSEICMMLVVAVNEQRDRIATADKLIAKLQDAHFTIPLKVVRISPWGGVTHALNLLLHHVRVLLPQSQFILFQSPEVLPDNMAVKHLLHVIFAHPNTLVVGQAFKEHREPLTFRNHETGTVITELTGDVCPWNTMALWNIQMLTRTGFPSVVDEVHPPGMEEIGVIAIQQMLYGPMNAMARIYHNPRGIKWFTNFDDPLRRERHRRKVETKISRGKEITQMLGLQEKGFCPLVALHYISCQKDQVHEPDFEGQASD